MDSNDSCTIICAQKSLFKPIIASSLALFLSTNFANAQTTCTSTANNGLSGIAVCYAETKNRDFKEFNKTSGNPAVNTLFKVEGNSYQTQSKDLTLQYNMGGGAGQSPSITGSNDTITMGGNVTNQYQPTLKLQTSNGKSLKIGSEGKGNLTINFGNASNSGMANQHARKIILDLQGKGNGSNNNGSNVSLEGNIIILGGRAQKWFGENQLEATFGGDMIGNITAKAGGNYFDQTSKFTFKDNANLKGNVTTRVGTNNFEFGETTNNGNQNSITGKITSDNANNHITFKSKGVMNGDMEATGGLHSYNKILFKNEATIGTQASSTQASSTQATSSTATTSIIAKARFSYNFLKFENKATLNLKDIKTDHGGGTFGDRQNVLSFEGNNGGNSSTIVVENITADPGGENYIGKNLFNGTTTGTTTLSTTTTTTTGTTAKDLNFNNANNA